MKTYKRFTCLTTYLKKSRGLTKSVDKGKPYDKRLMSFKTKTFYKCVVNYEHRNEI